jgi:hypothetical protein
MEVLMKRLRLAVVGASLVAVAMVTVLAGSGSAANRDGEAHLLGNPGPGSVTYGKNAAYQSTFANVSASGVFTHTTFTLVARVADGAPATFVAASCGNQQTTVNAAGKTQYQCDLGTVRPADPPLLVTIVWAAPDLSTGHPSCTLSSPCVLLGTATWSVKERINDQPDVNDSFGTETVQTTLLGQPNEVEAGGFQVGGSATSPTACRTTTTPSLETNRSLNAVNRLSTRLCLPSFSAGAALGLAAKIDEADGTAAEVAAGLLTQVSTVCVADLGAACGQNIPFDFGTQKLISVFQVPDAPGLRIRRWFHQPDGAPGLLTSYPMTIGCSGGGNCAEISLDAKNKIWTIVTQTSTNGRFGGG